MPKNTPVSNQYDLAIAGGGLAGGLVALALQKLRPELEIALIEADNHFGGNHIWSFFETDIEPEHRWLVEPLISQSWDSYDVHFPKYSRSFGTGYRSVTSDHFDKILRKMLPKASLKAGHKIAAMEKGLVTLENGDQIAAKAVIDARGGGDISALEYGWQKFCGQMLRLEKPHGVDRPIIMDATVDQIDGYRFVYCLPFGDREIFVEDTYYSDDRDLDQDALHQRIASYAADQEWKITEITRSEHGCLPVLYGGDFDAFWNNVNSANAKVGARAALVHPVTSYSLPMAVRTAIKIAEMPIIAQKKLDDMLYEYSASHWQTGKFYRMLCAMMFKAAKPDKRYLTLEHTYRKDQALIERFYAGKTTMLDQAALLSGKPPVPITKALPIMMKYR
ncbi:lycopene beta-cyclase CrtY [Parasphingorhabdus halotolerans]|uniref:Lycopene beta-cyclase CrtY n=1 Tax=Parasphingorhabdus halotolerans TaxID=2725558 RepID=A0A6H2DJY3_9SPHN|nr:lycopene beta-cyclase CrtY [Parasphingorhabdus halotolerans]QJB68700.1 lycopene beta-cyclase CrtY [Parasphingorhabdus halotolerans]